MQVFLEELYSEGIPSGQKELSLYQFRELITFAAVDHLFGSDVHVCQ